MLYIDIKINFLLIQTLCQISKRLYGESIPCDYLRTAPRLQKHTNILQPSKGITKVSYSDIINHLPLKIFIWLQSQESQLHNKCLFCSIKVPLYIPKSLFCWRVLFSNPLAQRQSKHADEYILIVQV